jgi:MFS family permease
MITLAAAAILMVTMGARQSLGLFISPLQGSTGLGITTISLAFAVAQMMWGVIQPVAGAVADRHGAATILIAGLVVLAISMALTPFMASGLGLIFSLGVLSAVGSGAASFSVLIGAAARHLTTDKRGKAAGIINAGGSLGQFVFAPVAQTLIQMLGWMGAMWSLAVITVGTLPLVGVVSPGSAVRGGAGATGSAPWQAVQDAVEDRSYLLLNAGFFTCGFHIAFLVTHLPGQVNLCGLPPAVASWSLPSSASPTSRAV